MDVISDIGIGTVFIWKDGRLTIKSTITEFEPNTRVAWKGETLGINAYHVWEFSDKGNTTQIYTEE